MNKDRAGDRRSSAFFDGFVFERSERWALLISILLPAFWLRLYLLDGQSLWWDEGISLHLATSTFGEIAANRVTNIHPPMYFFLLKIWVTLTGTSVFAARYTSVLASFAQLALAYALLNRWFGRSTAAIGLVLMAVWSASIVYAQELRVYAFLPLVYLLLLLLTREAASGRAAGKTWILLGLTEWVALHLHYNAIFLLIFLNAWGLFALWRRPHLLRRWFIVQAAVVVASLPWAVAVLLNWTAVRAEANLAGFATQPPAWGFVLPQVWGFHLTGLVSVLNDLTVQSLSLILLLLMALLLLWSLVEKSLGRSIWLLLLWLGPLVLGFAVWLVRSFSHPRYVLLFAPGLILLLACLLTPRALNGGTGKGWPAGANIVRLFTAAAFFWLAGWGLVHYFFDPAFAKDDIRAVADILDETAAASDLILVPRTDWSLPFTYDGEVPIRMADAFHQERMWDDLAGWTSSAEYVFTLDYRDNFYDWQKVVPFALESSGSLVGRWQIDNLRLSQFRLSRPVVEPQLEPQDGRFGDMALLGSWVAPEATTAEGLTVALKWRLLAPVSHDYSLRLSLNDEAGLDYAYLDEPLVTSNGRLTSRWDVGEAVTTYHLLPLVAGTPPLSFRLGLRVYTVEADEVQTLDYLDSLGTPQGQVLSLGEVPLERPLPGQAQLHDVALPLALAPLPDPPQLADGLRLTHASLDRSQTAPGEAVGVVLRWQAAVPLPNLRPRLVLHQGSQALAIDDSAPVHNRYPTNLWEPGELVLEKRLLIIPAAAEPGVAAVTIELADFRYLLGEVTISAAMRSFEPPAPEVEVAALFGEVARLVGFDPPPASLPIGQPIPLTLYWQSLGTNEPVAYTVFTQVLAEDGRLVAQHDAPPDNGRRPTTGWVEGEFISDAHLLTFREPDFAGEGQIVIGLYDPVTGARLTLPDGRDAFLLPLTLTIDGEDDG